MTHLIDPRIERARARYARSIVGSWSTALGTFGVVMGQRWDILPDGHGRFVDTGPFGAPTCETRFDWRQDRPFVFELRETDVVEHGPPEAQAEAEADEEADAPSAWIAIAYDFILVPTDVGEQVGLVDVRARDAKDASFHFHWSPAPLAPALP